MKSVINRVNESKVSTSLLGIQAIWLVIALLPNLSFFTRLSLVIGITPLVIWKTEQADFKKLFFAVISIFIGIAVFIRILFNLLLFVPNYVLQFLTLGIDNDPHVQMFKEMDLVSGQIPLISYPKGQQTLWYFLGKLGGISFSSPERVIAAYGTLYSFTLFAIFVIAWRIINNLSPVKDDVIFKTYFYVLIFLFGSFSFMVVAGYPHYMWALLTILILVDIVVRTTEFLQIFVSAAFASCILFLTCQPFVLATGSFMVVLLFKQFSNIRSKSTTTVPRRVIFIALGLLMLIGGLGVRWLSQINVVDWVTDDASAEPISVVQLVLTVAISFFLIKKFEIFIDRNVKLIAFLMISVSLAMAAYTIIRANEVTYYAVKQLQYSFIFLLLIVFSIFDFRNSKITVRALAAVLILAQFIPVARPKFFSGPLMGSGHQALALFTQPQTWEVISLDSNQTLRDANTFEIGPDECAIYWKPERILISQSTWMNAIQPNGLRTCFDYTYLEYTENENEIQEVLKYAPNRFVILYLPSKPPNFEKLDSDKVRFIEIQDLTPDKQ